MSLIQIRPVDGRRFIDTLRTLCQYEELKTDIMTRWNLELNLDGEHALRTVFFYINNNDDAIRASIVDCSPDGERYSFSITIGAKYEVWQRNGVDPFSSEHLSVDDETVVTITFKSLTMSSLHYAYPSDVVLVSL